MVDSQGLAVIIDLGMVVKVPLPDAAIAPPVKFAAARGWPCRCGKLLYLAPEVGLSISASVSPSSSFVSLPSFSAWGRA